MVRAYVCVGVCMLAALGLYRCHRDAVTTATANANRERDVALAAVDGWEQRAELDQSIGMLALLQQILTQQRLREIEARGAERVVVYRDRVRELPVTAACGPGAERVAAVNEALR